MNKRNRLIVCSLLLLCLVLLIGMLRPPEARSEKIVTSKIPALIECSNGIPDALVQYVKTIDAANYSTKSPTKAAAVSSQTEKASDKNGNCISCHSDASHLMKNVKPAEAPPEDGCATATSRPAFLDVFVKPAFTETVHGEIGCTGCHGGDSEATTAADAHNNLTPGSQTCVNCHQDISQRHETSLHKTLNGMRHALELRSGAENFHSLETAWNADCASCHAECADCHITQPAAIGGGVCHGSRAGGEYLGNLHGVEPDVHFEAGMHCLDCHKNDLHGDGNEYLTRWEVKDSPRCTDCHQTVPNQTALAHDSSHEDVSCQVCHSQPYQNCSNCHATMEDGQYSRTVESKQLDFKIGKNTAENYHYDIVPLRNNPASRDSFDYFDENLLPHHDAYPTWRTAAPHNIQRITKQNRSCGDCHGNEEIFLKEIDLDPNGADANKRSLLPELP